MALDLYVITDEKIGRGRSHAELARLSCEGGADAIQLRDKFRSPGSSAASAGWSGRSPGTRGRSLS
ncbi:MAG: hypothetical protein WC367_04185 [Methanoregula sp.]